VFEIFCQVTWTTCLATALFVKEVEDLFHSFIGVAGYPDHGKLLHCLLTCTIRYMESWRSVFDKVTTWTHSTSDALIPETYIRMLLRTHSVLLVCMVIQKITHLLH
jgi:hypothetical protein